MSPQILTVFDTETTAANPTTARLVQYAAVTLEVPSFQLIQVLTFLVRPDGILIPDEAVAIHGYTTEFAARNGYPLSFVLSRHEQVYNTSDMLFAWNVTYDATVILEESRRNEKFLGWMSEKYHDAMRPLASVCKLPNPSGRAGFKKPKLIEAYQHFFQKPFTGQHNALGDVFALVDILRVCPWLWNPEEKAPV